MKATARNWHARVEATGGDEWPQIPDDDGNVMSPDWVDVTWKSTRSGVRLTSVRVTGHRRGGGGGGAVKTLGSATRSLPDWARAAVSAAARVTLPADPALLRPRKPVSQPKGIMW